MEQYAKRRQLTLALALALASFSSINSLPGLGFATSLGCCLDTAVEDMLDR